MVENSFFPAKTDPKTNSHFSLRFSGCHNPPCGTGSLDGGEERKENFKSKLFLRCSLYCFPRILTIFFVPEVLEVFFEPDGSPRVQTPSGMPSFFNATDHEQIQAFRVKKMG